MISFFSKARKIAVIFALRKSRDFLLSEENCIRNTKKKRTIFFRRNDTFTELLSKKSINSLLRKISTQNCYAKLLRKIATQNFYFSKSNLLTLPNMFVLVSFLTKYGLNMCVLFVLSYSNSELANIFIISSGHSLSGRNILFSASLISFTILFKFSPIFLHENSMSCTFASFITFSFSFDKFFRFFEGLCQFSALFFVATEKSNNQTHFVI